MTSLYPEGYLYGPYELTSYVGSCPNSEGVWKSHAYVRRCVHCGAETLISQHQVAPEMTKNYCPLCHLKDMHEEATIQGVIKTRGEWTRDLLRRGVNANRVERVLRRMLTDQLLDPKEALRRIDKHKRPKKKADPKEQEILRLAQNARW